MQRLIGVATLICAAASAAGAQTVRVPQQFGSIQQAINAVSSGTTILVATGVYNERIDYGGKDIVIRAVDGPAATTLDGRRAGSVVTFRSGETSAAILDGFTIRHGSGTSLCQSPWGGGVFCDGASPTIMNCRITGNSATNGGGMFIRYSGASPGPRILGTTFSANTLTANQASGSAVYIIGRAIIQNCTIMRESGNAVHVYSSTGPPTQILNTVFADNIDRFGDMWPWTAGGVACTSWSQCVISHCTFFNNRCPGPYGIDDVYSGQGSNIDIRNCIFGTPTHQSPSLFAGIHQTMRGAPSVLTVSDSLVFGGVAVTGSAQSSLVYASSNIDADPRFFDVASRDFHLRYDSPCRDTASTLSATPFDFEGDPRGAMPDMGADEIFPHLYVVGSTRPGSTFHIRIAAPPASGVILAYTFNATPLSPPLIIPGLTGALELAPPIALIPLAATPASGIANVTVSLPQSFPGLPDLLVQALVSTRLTNSVLMSIR